MTTPHPRNTYRWKQLRRALFSTATQCALCGLEIHKGLPPRSKWAPSLDHIVPLIHGGSPYDLNNLQVVHFRCNSSKGATQRQHGAGAPPVRPHNPNSREW